jgi:hypothetical protein
MGTCHVNLLKEENESRVRSIISLSIGSSCGFWKVSPSVYTLLHENRENTSMDYKRKIMQ